MDLEAVPGDYTTFSEDEARAIEHFQDTHFRNEEGRFIVRLPRKQPVPELGESRVAAVRRYHQNKRSLIKKSSFQNLQQQ